MGKEEDTEGLEREEIKEFSPDCYLLDYAEDIINTKSPFSLNIGNTGGVYFTSRHIIDGAPQSELANSLGIPVNPNFIKGFTSNFNNIFVKLAGRNDLKQFGELTSLNIAGLHPRIKLFRIDQSESGQRKKREFLFNYGTSINASSDIFENSQIKGGAGIKSLSYTLAGTNPAEAERAIDVSITFAFQSVNDFIGFTSGKKSGLQQLVEFRNNVKNSYNTFVGLEDGTDSSDFFGQQLDLVSTTTNYISLIERPSSVPNEYNARNFQIVAEIGYSVNQSEEVISQELRQRIEGMNLNLVLNLINHELTFTEEGSLELKVNYYGSLQQYMNDPETDYFTKKFEENEKYKNAKNNIDELTKKIKELRTNINNKCDGYVGKDLDSAKSKLESQLEQLEKKKEEKKEIDNNVRSSVYSSFISDLYRKQILYSFTINKEDVSKWVRYINDPESNDKPEFTINKDMGNNGSKLNLVSEINSHHFGKFIDIQELKKKIQNI